jgi:hypothetical protein
MGIFHRRGRLPGRLYSVVCSESAKTFGVNLSNGAEWGIQTKSAWNSSSSRYAAHFAAKRVGAMDEEGCACASEIAARSHHCDIST